MNPQKEFAKLDREVQDMILFRNGLIDFREKKIEEYQREAASLERDYEKKKITTFEYNTKRENMFKRQDGDIQFVIDMLDMLKSADENRQSRKATSKTSSGKSKKGGKKRKNNSRKK
jgi:hypothetical protein